MTADPLTLINGIAATQVAAMDRGLNYGDGVFRTLRIDAGTPRWWQDQFAKLQQDCISLDLPCPPREIWESDLAQLAIPRSGVLRLCVTRGVGPRGYQFPKNVTPTRIVTLWATEHDSQPAPGIRARLCRLRLGHQPALAGIKHLNRLENVLARAEWQDPAIREGILLDQAGQVVSGVMSNLFIWKDGILHTPRLDRCGVAGMARQLLMERAARAGHDVRETPLALGDLHAADEILFTNSLILLWRVARLEDRAWETPAVSPELWKLLHA